MQIKSKKQLDFYLQADMMMNFGKFKPSLTDRLVWLLCPNYLLLFLRSMRRLSYYKYKVSSGWGGYFISSTIF